MEYEGGFEVPRHVLGGTHVVGLTRLKLQGGVLCDHGVDGIADGGTVIGDTVTHRAEILHVQDRVVFGTCLLCGIYVFHANLGQIGIGERLGFG